MPTKKTDDLPDFKDQCQSRCVGQDPPARRIPPSSPRPQPANSNQEGPGIKDQVRSFRQPDNAEEPPAVETIVGVAVQIPVTVEAVAETITLSDEESQRPAVPPPPQATAAAAGRRQEDVIARVIRRYAAYLLLLILVLIAAGVVVGVCASSKCSNGGGPNSTEAPTPTETPTVTSTTGQPTPKPTSPVTTLAPTETPTSTPTPETTNRPAAIAAFINSITLTNKTIAYPPPSNGTGSETGAEEQAALQWLIESDPLNLTASDQFRLQQRYALAAFWFSTTRNGYWIDTMGWLTTQDECNWIGINCTDVVGVGGAGEVQSVVERIALHDNNIQGGIPVELGLLPSLKTIDLHSNALSGSLPFSIGQWSNLETIDLSWNSFSGSLPDSIGQWSNLETFRTWNNKMTGTLPASIGLWNNLTTFYIDSNSYTGTLPDSIGKNWSKVERFSVSNNALTGTIPKSIENWKNIIQAYFEGNDFTGSMPTGICNAINATVGVLWADCSEVNCTCCTQCY
jgi:Leucine Rich Repeat